MLATGVLLGIIVGVRGVIGQEARPSDMLVQENPVPATPASLAAGKRAYDEFCAACHGDRAQGAERAGLVLSIIEEQGRRQPPDLTDDVWDHGSSDSAIFAVIKQGIPPTMMAGYDGKLSDAEIWHVINYVHALATNPDLEIAPTTVEEARRLQWP